jgi:putative ABC transport system permease protein
MNDLRFALRQLRKSPGFTLTAIVTIALGIGATTAIFTVLDATLLAPLPYPNSEQLVSIQDDLLALGAHDVGMSQPEWQDLQRSGVFEYVSPTWFDENNLTGSEQPARIRLLIVAPNYFELLRVKPRIGRGFDPVNHSPGFVGEIVISDSLWRRGFNADPHILDRSVRMDTDLYRIVGVMPPGFDAPGRTAEERNIEIWAATSFYGAPMPDHPRRSVRNLPTAVARLKPGLSIAAAQKRIDALVDSLQKQFSADYPDHNAWRIRLVPLKAKIVGNVRQSLVLLFGAVGLVLLISCVNIANLLLARSSMRGREMALRQAVGASRARLVRQLLTESLLLSLLGGIAGFAILFGVKDFLLKFVPHDLPRLNEISISWTVLLFAFGASVFSGVFFGVAPAFQAGRVDLQQAFKQEGQALIGSAQRARTRRGLVITEFALALILMVAAALLLHSFWDLLNVRTGFNTQNVVTVRTRMPYPNDIRIDKYATASQESPFLRELTRRCARLPGVEEVALGDPATIPLDQSGHELNILEGHFYVTLEGANVDQAKPVMVQRARVTPEYFHLLGLSLTEGRLFNEFDTDTAPQVAVVNEAFARNYWPNEKPLGKRLRSTRPGSQWITVVGVIANARTESLAQADVPQLYVSMYQTGAKHLAIFLRGHFTTAAIEDEVRRQVQSLDATLPVFGVQTLPDTVSESLSQRRFSLEVIAFFALTALLLASIGVYGVISYLVAERTREIGIRLALGAQKKNILRVILQQGFQLAIAGAAIGIVCAVIVSHLMASLLYGVKPTDPLSFATVAVFFVFVALLACYLPARRAMKIDPMVALRHQ